MAKNLMALLPKLNKKDLQNIAKAVRRKGYLTDYLHFGHAANAIGEIAFLELEVVITALRDAAPTYPEALETIRNLQSKRRSHPGMNRRKHQAR